jgi:hypothetical protein
VFPVEFIEQLEHGAGAEAVNAFNGLRAEGF